MSISCKTIIDGYNLLHALGVMRPNLGPGGLERARMALLNCLAASLDPSALAATVVVFDARTSPLDAAATTEHRGITVLYAKGYEDADALIQELIRRHSAPKRLTVVSSDRAVQQAADRRRAKALGSEAWYDAVLSRRPQPAATVGPAADVKPAVPLAPEQVEHWLSQFAAPLVDVDGAPHPPPPEPVPDAPVAEEALKPGELAGDEIGDAFPAGYIERIERELRSGEW